MKIGEEKICKYLQQIGIGRIYHNVNPERIIPKNEIAEYLHDFPEKIESGKGLLLSGGTGVGKTSILSWIARNAFRFGSWTGYRDDGEFVPLTWVPNYKVIFISVSRFFNLIFERRSDLIEKYQKADLLLLDDFGREYQVDFPISRFEEFIEYRYANMLSMCITTNLLQRQMRQLDIYERIIDRFRDKKIFKLIEIAGQSQRKSR